jgi:hypothetical protein
MQLSRRRFLVAFPCTAGVVLAAGSAGMPLRGKLVKGPGDRPALQTPDGKLLFLTGDEDTLGVLKDKRLAGADFEVIGTRSGDTVEINPIHTSALFAYKEGKRLRVTYWCDVCAIRTYTPGLCWCCREETALDFQDPDTVDNK